MCSKVNPIQNRIDDVMKFLTHTEEQLKQVQAWHALVEMILPSVRVDKPKIPFTHSKSPSEAPNVESVSERNVFHGDQLVTVDNLLGNCNLVLENHRLKIQCIHFRKCFFFFSRYSCFASQNSRHRFSSGFVIYLFEACETIS